MSIGDYRYRYNLLTKVTTKEEMEFQGAYEHPESAPVTIPAGVTGTIESTGRSSEYCFQEMYDIKFNIDGNEVEVTVFLSDLEERFEIHLPNRQEVLDVLNSLEVVDRNGGEEAWALVEVNEEMLADLEKVGVPREVVLGYGDEETTCIIAIGCNEGYATYYDGTKLIYDPDFDLRTLVDQ